MYNVSVFNSLSLTSLTAVLHRMLGFLSFPLVMVIGLIIISVVSIIDCSLRSR